MIELAARLWRAPILLLVLAELFWAGSFVLGGAVRADVPPVALAFWRWVGGLVLVLCFAGPHLVRDLPVLRRHWRITAVMSVFGVGGYNTLIYLGLQTTTVLNAALLQSAMPLLILLCSFMIFGERPSLRQFVAVLISLGGVAVIVAHGEPATLLRLRLNPGDIWVLIAALIYAAYSALLRRRPTVHPLSFLAASFAVGVLTLLPFYTWEILAGHHMRLTPLAVTTLIYLAMLPAFASYLFYNRGVELIGANRAGQFMHLIPVFASILAIALLGESFQIYHMVGIALIAAGIVLASRGGTQVSPAFPEAGAPPPPVPRAG
ncbi:MAG: DMT family transporter [Acidisphaera sp.]|nr:DMT family transporter [Acidisphaera sp.]